jgi:AbrB family looped-hinge helix DNA binding protein
MTTKGQITVPVEVRRALGLQAGSKVEFVRTERGVYELVVKTGSIRDLYGMLPAPARAVTLEEMDDAIADGAAEGNGPRRPS